MALNLLFALITSALSVQIFKHIFQLKDISKLGGDYEPTDQLLAKAKGGYM